MSYVRNPYTLSLFKKNTFTIPLTHQSRRFCSQRYRAGRAGTVRLVRGSRSRAATWWARAPARRSPARTQADASAATECSGAPRSPSPTCTRRGTSASSISQRRWRTVSIIRHVHVKQFFSAFLIYLVQCRRK